VTSSKPEKPVRPIKYTPEQREAVAVAREAGRTGPQVARLAAAGKLRHDGQRLPAFQIPPASVRTISVTWRKRRAREGMDVELSEMPHRDAVEVLRRSLLDVAQVELRRMRKAQRRTGAVTWTEIRELARCVGDLARLPGPLDPPPATRNQPDARTGLRGVESRPGGEAGVLLRAHRGEHDPDRPAAQAPTPRVEPDYEPKPVDEEPAVVDPGPQIAEELRAAIEAAARSNGDGDGDQGE
jgi:hypothetical protein